MLKIHKKVAESSSYNLLTIYLTFIFGILNTFILARILLPEEWALIILILSFINIAIFFCNLFPPNAQESIKYYIPHLSSEGKDKGREKSNFITHVFKVRLSFALLIFILYLIITSFANFEVTLFEIILITAPIILFKIIRELNNSILLAYQKFRLVFFSKILNPITVTFCNFLIFFFKLKNPLILIANVFLLGEIIPCIISIIIVITLIPIKKKGKKRSLNQKNDFYEIHRKYGIYLILSDIFGLLSGLLINLLFLKFGLIIFITWLTICQISVISALWFSSSNPSSYISIFSEVNYEKNPKAFENLFYRLNKFLLMFVCIIVGIMLFYVELYIAIIYSETYLIIVRPLQLFLFTAFAQVIINNLIILTQSTNNTKINAELSFIQMITNVSLTLLALLFFDFYNLILFYVVCSFIMPFIMVYLINKQTLLKLNPMTFFKPFVIFLVSFIVVFPLNYYIDFRIFDKAYLNFFLNGTIKFSIFVFIFYIIFFLTKIITKEEFNQLIKIIPILNSDILIIKKLVKLIEKFLPSK